MRTFVALCRSPSSAAISVAASEQVKIDASACQPKEDRARVLCWPRLSVRSSLSHQRSKHMAKRLSEQLADLSVRTKNAEDAVDAAKKEAHDKFVVRQEQARADTKQAVEKANQELKAIGDTAEKNWSAVRAKIAADMTALKAEVAHVKHDHDAQRAGQPADPLEQEAGL